MNNIEVTGRLTKDPEIKYTATGVAVAKFRLAENIYNKKEGKQDAQFHNVVAFGKTAENIGNTLSKGRKIHVSGSVKHSSYLKMRNAGLLRKSLYALLNTVIVSPALHRTQRRDYIQRGQKPSLT